MLSYCSSTSSSNTIPKVKSRSNQLDFNNANDCTPQSQKRELTWAWLVNPLSLSGTFMIQKMDIASSILVLQGLSKVCHKPETEGSHIAPPVYVKSGKYHEFKSHSQVSVWTYAWRTNNSLLFGDYSRLYIQCSIFILLFSRIFHSLTSARRYMFLPAFVCLFVCLCAT